MISFVIPVFNRNEILERCLSSIAHEAVETLEIIIVDDGSEKENPKMAFERARLKHKTHSWKFLRLDSNQGAMAARKLGIEHAIGEWIILFDSDDEISKGGLKFLSDYLRAQATTKVIGFECRRLNNPAENSHTLKVTTVTNSAKYLQWVENGDRISDYTMCYHRDVFKSIDFPCARISEIWWFLRLVDITPIEYVSQQISIYHNDAPDQLSARRGSVFTPLSDSERQGFLVSVNNFSYSRLKLKKYAPHFYLSWVRHFIKMSLRQRSCTLAFKFSIRYLTSRLFKSSGLKGNS